VKHVIEVETDESIRLVVEEDAPLAGLVSLVEEEFNHDQGKWVPRDWLAVTHPQSKALGKALLVATLPPEARRDMPDAVQVLDDYAEAAGELLGGLPEPGSEMAKLLHANVMMRKYRIPELEARVAELEAFVEKAGPALDEGGFVLAALLRVLESEGIEGDDPDAIQGSLMRMRQRAERAEAALEQVLENLGGES